MTQARSARLASRRIPYLRHLADLASIVVHHRGKIVAEVRKALHLVASEPDNDTGTGARSTSDDEEIDLAARCGEGKNVLARESDILENRVVNIS